MFDVLVFVYENYWRGDACPPWQQLERKLSAVGFEAQEIRDALTWLNGLNIATRETRPATESEAGKVTGDPAWQQSPDAMRVYSVDEQNRLGSEGLGFIRFLENAGVLPPPVREVALDRAMASNADMLTLEDLKIILLMVYWSFGEEPDALILDELCDDASDRLAH